MQKRFDLPLLILNGALALLTATTTTFAAGIPCRVYGTVAGATAPSLHAGSADECAALAAKPITIWAAVPGTSYQAELPDVATGTCPAGSVDVGQLFSNRDSVAPYTGNPGAAVAAVTTAKSRAASAQPFPVVLCASASVAAGATYAPATPPYTSILVTAIALDTFSFSSSATVAPGVTVVSYAWNFGDGTTASGATATHRYTASGTYPVVLTVTDSRGVKGSAIRSVAATVVPPSRPPTGPVVVGPPGSWTRSAASYPAGTEAEYQSWYNLVFDTRRNLVYGMSWLGVMAAFNPATGVWTKLTPNIGGGVHNRSFAYDPINDRVWIGSGTGSQLIGMNYFDPAGKQLVSYPMSNPVPGAEAAMIYDPAGRRLIVFGGWNRLGVYTWSLSPLATAMVSAKVPPGPTWDGGIAPDAKKMTAWRSVLDSKRNRIVYVDTDGSVWALPLSLTGWQHLTTTGSPPPPLTQYVYDVANDALVGWSASPRIAGGDPTPGTTRQTWLLPLSTLAWSEAANLASGNTVPVDAVYVAYAMVYDPIHGQTILHTLSDANNYDPSTWVYRYPSNVAPPPPPPPPPPPANPPPPAGGSAPSYTGRITSFPLPALVGAPYSTLQHSKHTNMAYSPLTNRLYVSGGDWVHSATDGTWSMSMIDGSWREDVGDPVYPTLPAPHAAQDEMGFTWDAGRQKFLFWPGSYFAYEAPGSPILNYAKGLWLFDPASDVWTQELGLFGTYLESTGDPFGGVYDEINDQFVVLGDDTSGFVARRWSVGGLTRLPDVPISLNRPKGFSTYYTRTQYTKIGRYVYVAGYSTDGTSLKVPRFWRWHLDNHTMEELAAPPVDGSWLVDIEIRLANSHGKVVWPLMSGPDGELHGIFIYDPATNVWSVDHQVPSYGNFIGNAVTSLPDGRVAFSGGVFGRQQTHMWFYEATQ
ncbi:MAG TPA: PKD domain-containing protein, partial [Casimicrobiaceae bacterium]|nr:PKD domain-containing protein [Casimicrobiaceae bacterium]